MAHILGSSRETEGRSDRVETVGPDLVGETGGGPGGLHGTRENGGATRKTDLGRKTGDT